MIPHASAHLRSLVLGRPAGAHRGGRGRAVGQAAMALMPAPARTADDITGRVEARLEDTLAQVPQDEIGDPREFRRALAILLRETQRAARKVIDDGDAPLGPGDAAALEAVVRADGTRPTLQVRNGSVDPKHPLAGGWAELLASTADAMRRRCAAVGRIEPANATSHTFFGTGWVVDAAAALVLTNMHVVEAMWRRQRHLMARTPSGFTFTDGAFIDFAAESGSVASNRFRIVEARTSGIEGQRMLRLDAAVLRIEPTEPGQEIPAAIPVVADPDGPRGELASFCVVGFPAAPIYSTGLHEGVDWSWVNATLFGNRYGVKRLAPGIAHRPLGSIAGDGRRWVFGHDPTTLAGNSGSPVVGWLDTDPAAFGLHFAGASLDTNCAHAFSACAEPLRTMGVPL